MQEVLHRLFPVIDYAMIRSSSFLRQMHDKLLREPRLCYALGGLVTVSLSVTLGFYAGSTKDGKTSGAAAEAMPNQVASISGKRPSTATRGNDVSSSADSSSPGDGAAAGSFQGNPHFKTFSGPAPAVLGASAGAAAVGDGASSSMPRAQATALSAASAMPEVPDFPRILIPVAFQNFDPAAIGLSNYQATALNQIRSDFNAQLTGQQQNPADPQYAQSWESAQMQADDRVRALLGWDQFNQLQIKAFQKR